MRTNLINSRFTFDLPFWVMNEEFSRPSRVNEHVNGNVIEDALSEHNDFIESCLNHQCWVTFETSVSASQMPAYIASAQRFVEQILKTYHTKRVKH